MSPEIAWLHAQEQPELCGPEGWEKGLHLEDPGRVLLSKIPLNSKFSSH